jgi:hypothetical protein
VSYWPDARLFDRFSETGWMKVFTVLATFCGGPSVFWWLYWGELPPMDWVKSGVITLAIGFTSVVALMLLATVASWLWLRCTSLIDRLAVRWRLANLNTEERSLLWKLFQLGPDFDHPKHRTFPVLMERGFVEETQTRWQFPPHVWKILVRLNRQGRL